MYRRRYYDSSYSRPTTSYSRRSYNESRPSSYYYRSSFPGLLSYGPSRPSEYRYPWEVDVDFNRRRREARTVRGEEREQPSDERDLRNPERDEEVNKEFHVLKVDLNAKKNARDHNTDKYHCVKKGEMVVRRGQNFVITIHFDREYNDDRNKITFLFRIGKENKPSKGTFAKFVMMEDRDDKPEDPKDWFAKMVKKDKKSIDVEITAPCICIIGVWRFSIQTESKLKDEKPLTLDYKHNEDICVLMNPWCEDDLVYMVPGDLNKEYILNEKGAIWSGNYKQKGVKPWNFGQFHENILKISLHLLRKVYNDSIDPAMGDPIKVSRAISKILNSSDEGGVLEGNWSGDYSGGTPPTKWTGSVPILKEYYAQKSPVKYGQCWVFSAITTTVCRCLGIPCRSVTNFASAHDTEGTTTIDKFYSVSDNGLEDISANIGSSDSVWNFHVWNECWMKRPDLQGYDGWQAIDATPQETSGGVYQCGPCPVDAIKKGDISVQYDATFIFAEVNADRVTWHETPDGYFEAVETETSSVGKDISTKVPDGKPYGGTPSTYWRDREKWRLDVTDNYKFKEGTIEERIAVKNAYDASGYASSFKRDVLNPADKKDDKEVSIEIIDKDGVMVGSDFEVEILLKNVSSRYDTKNIKTLQVLVDSVKYTGDGRRNIVKKMFHDIRLGRNGEEKLSFTVTKEEYWDKMYELFNMEITVSAIVVETDNYHLKKDEYRLRRPDITAKAEGKIKVGVPFKAKITLDNPLHVPLTDLSLAVEGDGVLDKNFDISGNIPAGKSFVHTVELVAEEAGEIQINFNLDCKELKDIVGFCVVDAS